MQTKLCHFNEYSMHYVYHCIKNKFLFYKLKTYPIKHFITTIKIWQIEK